MTAALHVVLPGAIDDPAAPSGGNTYDRRLLDALVATRDVHEIAVAGGWPYPSEAARTALARALDELPAGATVLLDGLVGCAVPEVLEPRAGRLRLIVLVHLPLGDESGLAPAAAAELRARERRTVSAAAVVVATSHGAARHLEDLHGLADGAVLVAEPGVDPAPLAEAGAAGNRLLCVAAVTPRKAQDVLVEALHELADLDWTCTLVGALDRDPAFTAALRRRAAALPVEFAGTRTGAALARTYGQADLLVLPSLAETYGMVVTEALAHGVPVLGTEVDGVPEALGAAPDGTRPGELVPPGDPGALAAALRRWLTDPALRGHRRTAAAARRTALRGWEHTTRRWIEVLDT